MKFSGHKEEEDSLVIPFNAKHSTHHPIHQKPGIRLCKLKPEVLCSSLQDFAPLKAKNWLPSALHNDGQRRPP